MKRSEMLSKIDETLRGTFIDHSNFAEQILSTVESLGMMPPFSSKTFHKEWARHRDTNLVNGYQWEPENE